MVVRAGLENIEMPVMTALESDLVVKFSSFNE